MIHVTRINHAPVVLNSDLIEYIHAAPDTIIALVNGENLRVIESPGEIVERIIAFRRQIFRNALVCPGRLITSEGANKDRKNGC